MEEVMSNGNGANIVEVFAQRLTEAADKGPERMRRGGAIMTDMFRGHVRLLEDDFSFEEMFNAFSERISERRIGDLVRGFADTLKSIRGRARRFW